MNTSSKESLLLEKLPHRYPMRLVDAVLELRGNYIKALKNVTFNEPFFPGHFPSMPIMPGVLIIEALAQTSIVLAHNEFGPTDKQGLYLLVGIDNARFKRPVVPGDGLMLESSCRLAKGSYYTFDTTASVNGDIVARALIRSMFKEEPQPTTHRPPGDL